VHTLYQDQVVFNYDDIKATLMKPRTWSTQSSIVVILISQNHQSFSCVHTSSFIGGFLSKVCHISLKIKRLETYKAKFGNYQNFQKPSLLQNHYRKTSIGTKLTTLKCTLEPFYFDQSLDQRAKL
jgi:hypothetical protein